MDTSISPKVKGLNKVTNDSLKTDLATIDFSCSVCKFWREPPGSSVMGAAWLIGHHHQVWRLEHRLLQQAPTAPRQASRHHLTPRLPLQQQLARCRDRGRRPAAVTTTAAAASGRRTRGRMRVVLSSYGGATVVASRAQPRPTAFDEGAVGWPLEILYISKMEICERNVLKPSSSAEKCSEIFFKCLQINTAISVRQRNAMKCRSRPPFWNQSGMCIWNFSLALSFHESTARNATLHWETSKS